MDVLATFDNELMLITVRLDPGTGWFHQLRHWSVLLLRNTYKSSEGICHVVSPSKSGAPCAIVSGINLSSSDAILHRLSFRAVFYLGGRGHFLEIFIEGALSSKIFELSIHDFRTPDVPNLRYIIPKRLQAKLT